MYFLNDFDLASIEELAVSGNHVSHCPNLIFWTTQTLQCLWNPQSISFSRKSFSYNLNMSQNNSDRNGYGQGNSSGYGHPNHSGYGQRLASSSGYDHQIPIWLRPQIIPSVWTIPNADSGLSNSPSASFLDHYTYCCPSLFRGWLQGLGRNLSVEWNPSTTPDHPPPLDYTSFSPSLWTIEPSPSARPATYPGS